MKAETPAPAGRVAPWWRLAAALSFAAIVLGGVEPFYLRIFALDRAAFHQTLTELPYRKAPGLRLFLEHVRERTAVGDRVAIAVPGKPRYEAYDYVFARSLYALAGRRVIALVGKNDEDLSRNLAGADYLASWRSAPEPAGFEEVWRGPGGTLYRRQR